MQKDSLAREIGWLLKEKYREEPADYVVGFVEFAGCTINLSKRPFIPRPETEYWTRKAIEHIQYKIRDTKYKIRVLDLFAGSGCIGIAMLKHVPNATVDFAEKEKKFLKQIKVNAQINGIDSQRYRIVHSDVFSKIPGEYDVIVANPPYIAQSRISKVQPSVLDWEPRQALLAGPDGLLYIKKFFRVAKKHLNPEGKIFMEFDSFQKSAIQKLVKEFEYSSWDFLKDQYGKWRYVIVYGK